MSFNYFRDGSFGGRNAQDCQLLSILYGVQISYDAIDSGMRIPMTTTTGPPGAQPTCSNSDTGRTFSSSPYIYSCNRFLQIVPASGSQQGNLINTVPDVPNVQSCSALCTTTPGCSAVTYYRDGRTDPFRAPQDCDLVRFSSSIDSAVGSDVAFR
jgi:hypothetical protein